jgi:5S rRNA maturation endonuclease (ribonuclease M5)
MKRMFSLEQLRKILKEYLTSLEGYDPEKTQVLKSIKGQLVWVEEK